jgi:hypothetical protein
MAGYHFTIGDRAVVSKDYAYGQGIQNEVLSPKLLGLT